MVNHNISLFFFGDFRSAMFVELRGRKKTSNNPIHLRSCPSPHKYIIIQLANKYSVEISSWYTHGVYKLWNSLSVETKNDCTFLVPLGSCLLFLQKRSCPSFIDLMIFFWMKLATICCLVDWLIPTVNKRISCYNYVYRPFVESKMQASNNAINH